MKHYSFLLITFTLILLTACGGQGQTKTFISEPVAAEVNTQGGFQNISAPIRHSKANVQQALDAKLGSSQNNEARYDVEIRKIEYLTPDRAGLLQKASGVIALPVKSGVSPLLSYQHATIFKNAEAPSNVMDDLSSSVETLLASKGMVVISADYLGYGSTYGQSHPYLLREPSANVVIDLIKAAQYWLRFRDIQTTDDLLMMGYSQGGYVTMAAFQQIEAENNDLTVTAVSMGGGPYDLTTALDELLRGLNIPSFLQDVVSDLLADKLIPNDADVTIDRTFLTRFFDGDPQDNVHNWLPSIPVKLFHAKDDKTVPVESAYSTRDTMQGLGADIELILCSLSPAEHKNCVPEYIEYTFDLFAPYL